ncbi:uncharacterized protein [Panulirus ornatus]|uniref:uncharacterized protein isoform X2 n=1 Tax=Panulirus ornatus TaxID=150431 RepID=UPI003A836E9B
MVHSLLNGVLWIMANWWYLSSTLVLVDICLTHPIMDDSGSENSCPRTEVEMENKQGVTDISGVLLQVVDVKSSVVEVPFQELLPHRSRRMLSSEPNEPVGVELPQTTPVVEADINNGKLDTLHTNPLGSLQNSSRPLVETNITEGQEFHMDADSATLPVAEDGQPQLPIDREQNVQQGSPMIDPSVQHCSEETSFQPTIRNFICPNVASFYKFASESRGGHVAVRVARVDGGLSLASLADVALVNLFLQHSNITHFSCEDLHPQKNLSPLTKLDLSDNPDFDASGLTCMGSFPYLSYLLLRGTAVATLGSQLMPLMKHLPRLKLLDLSYTGLQDLPFLEFHHNLELKYLNIAGNNLCQVTLDEDLVHRLTHLNISWCGLEELRVEALSTNSTASQVPNLQSLDVSHNLLTLLPASLIDVLTRSSTYVVITNNSWHKACMNCSLYHLWNYATNVAPDFVVGGADLHCFEMEALHSCSWEECPLGCHCNKNNKSVNCTDAGLETIPFVGPSYAETLILANNHLSNMIGIESPAWCNLMTLRLEYNQLEILVSPGMTGHCRCQENEDYYNTKQDCFPQHLQMLSLTHNSVEGILAFDCPLLYPLQEIHLNWNKVQTLGAQSCGSLQQLQVLKLGHNNITSMEGPDFATYPNLQQLYISHNSLMTLQPRITDLMPKLRVLDISHNLLENFSDNRSPHSPFSSMESSPLEELYLDNNKFSQIEPIFDLKHISTLKKLTLDNNMWSCHCTELSKLQGRVWKELKNQVLISAVQTMKCHLPSSLKDTDINADTVTKACHERSHDRVFMSLVAYFIIIVPSLVICYSILIRRYKLCFLRKPLHLDDRDVTVGRRYDVFIVHSTLDNELVRGHVVIPLTHHGYCVAWHDNVFRPGDWVLENVEDAVRNSRRMLVIATDNLVRCRWSQQVIRRGRYEEFDKQGFKILALVMETLPRALVRDLYEIVALRTHVLFSNRDYVEKICNFLPAPAPQQIRPDGVYLTETDIQTLLQHFEEIRLRERQQQVPLSEVFSMQRESTHVTISVDIATTLEYNGESPFHAMSDEDRRSMARRLRMKPPPVKSNSQPPSLNYFLSDQDNEEEEEEEDEAQTEDFTRYTFTRLSCKF